MIRVTVVHSGLEGLPGYSQHFFEGDTQGEAEAAVTAVGDFWDDLSVVTSSALDSRTEAEVFQVDPATGLTTNVFTTTPRNMGGATSGDVNPFATQMLLRWRTGVFVGGREVRGRTFVPGTLEAQNTNGRPLAAALAFAQTAINTYLTASSGAGGAVVYSRANGQAALVSSGTPWDQWAVLRSRRD